MVHMQYFMYVWGALHLRTLVLGMKKGQTEGKTCLCVHETWNPPNPVQLFYNLRVLQHQFVSGMRTFWFNWRITKSQLLARIKWRRVSFFNRE